MNQNYTFFFGQMGKKYIFLCGAEFYLVYVRHEMKELENSWSREREINRYSS